LTCNYCLRFQELRTSLSSNSKNSQGLKENSYQENENNSSGASDKSSAHPVIAYTLSTTKLEIRAK
jgi:hypothetical protein